MTARLFALMVFENKDNNVLTGSAHSIKTK